MKICAYLALALSMVLTGCSQQTEVPETASSKTAAIDTINADDLLRRIEVLASDEFEGRSPSSPGEEKTVAFIANEFRQIGLAPGNGDSYFQGVPLVEITADPDTALTVIGHDKNMTFAYGSEVMAWTKRVTDEVAIDNSEMVFVGYGVVAPEYNWNDYDGVDVKGKTVVMLVNDPGYATQDPELFNGNAMTYYGRWTYKYEEAARQGAAGAIVIHETEPASYPWGVVSGSWSGPQFDLVPDDRNFSRVSIEGWVTREVAEMLFNTAGMDLDEMKAAALTGDFKPVSLGLNASMKIRNNVRESISRNVLGYLEGSERPNEYIIYVAHWDHIGKDDNIEGDGIYNGAVDNATGVSGIIEIAKAFASRETAPPRSVVFMAVTAEESGLLGSKHYAENPIFPLSQTVAVINIDSMDVYGEVNDIIVVGYGNSELEEYLADAAAQQGRTVKPEEHPERGGFYRSDHFNFAKHGVPALYAEGGSGYIGEHAQQAKTLSEAFVMERYHKPADEVLDTWDLTGAVKDLRLYYMIGEQLATDTDFPNWYAGNEFRAIRDASLQAADK